MSYEYAKERSRMFTDEGQRAFLRFRDNANKLLAQSGAFRAAEAMRVAMDDTWMHLACIDRMVELGEIIEVVRRGEHEVPAQHRVFVKGGAG